MGLANFLKILIGSFRTLSSRFIIEVECGGKKGARPKLDGLKLVRCLHVWKDDFEWITGSRIWVHHSKVRIGECMGFCLV